MIPVAEVTAPVPLLIVDDHQIKDVHKQVP